MIGALGAALRRCCSEFGLDPRVSYVVLVGGTGTGKSHLAIAIDAD